MSITLPPCKTCRFWGLPMARNGGWQAKCLRYPPQCHLAGGAEWPSTKEYDACGEHRPKDAGEAG